MYGLSSDFAISSVSGYTYGVQRNVGNELIFINAERYLDRLKDRPPLTNLTVSPSLFHHMQQMTAFVCSDSRRRTQND